MPDQTIEFAHIGQTGTGDVIGILARGQEWRSRSAADTAGAAIGLRVFTKREFKTLAKVRRVANLQAAPKALVIAILDFSERRLIVAAPSTGKTSQKIKSSAGTLHPFIGACRFRRAANARRPSASGKTKRAVRITGRASGDHIDESGQGLAAVEHGCRPADDFHPFDFFGRKIVELKRVAATKAIAVD